MTTWIDYRTAWSIQPWTLVYAVIVLAVFVLAIIGTLTAGPLALLFIPSLAGAYVHHLLVMRRLER